MTQKADPNGLKKCAKCGESKVRKDHFYYRYRSSGSGQWDSRCKECRIADWHEHQRDKRAEQPKAKRNLAPEGTKYCSRCDKYLPLDQFYVANGKPTTPCKECKKIEYSIKREGMPTREGFYRGKPAMTEEERRRKDGHREYQKRLSARGYTPAHTLEEWQALLDRTGHKCIKCGAPEEYAVLSKDHIIPLSEGGTDAIDNIQPLCLRCNGRKHTKVADYRGNTWVSNV